MNRLMRPLIGPPCRRAGGMISKAPRLPKQRRATAPPPGSYNPDRCFIHPKFPKPTPQNPKTNANGASAGSYAPNPKLQTLHSKPQTPNPADFFRCLADFSRCSIEPRALNPTGATATSTTRRTYRTAHRRALPSQSCPTASRS